MPSLRQSPPTIPMGYDQPIPESASVVHVTQDGGSPASIVARAFATLEDVARCRLCRNHACIARLQESRQCQLKFNWIVSPAEAWLVTDEGCQWESVEDNFVAARARLSS